MKKLKTIILFLILLLIPYASSQNISNEHEHTYSNKDKQAFIQRQKEIDEMLNLRLNLTEEQKQYIQTNRPKHREEIKKNVEKMKVLHSKIKDIYTSEIPKVQADIITAPMKTELAILKQNIDKLKEENRKNFENILTPTQKVEFEKIKSEYAKK